MEVVADFGLGGVDDPWRGVPGSAVDEGELPAAVVDHRVVGFADERGIVQVRFSAFLPRDYVVCFAPRGRGSAVGE